MAGVTLSTLSNVLKDYYLPPVVEQLNNEVLLISRLEAQDQPLYGNQAVIPVHTGRTSGIGARGELVALPAAGNQAYARAVYDLKYLYGRGQVSGPSMGKTASDAGAFLRSLQAEMDGLRNDLKKDLARQVYGTGDSVISGVVTGNSTTVTLPSAEPLRKGQIYPGMLIDIGTAADPDTVLAATNVVSVSVAGPSIVVGSTANVTGGTHFIRRAGSSNPAGGSINYEINGLQNIVATAANTFGGIDASQAANAYWDNLRVTTAGATMTLDEMQKAWGQVRVAGGQVDSMITSFGVQRLFFSLLQSQVRYTEPQTIRGGFKVLEFMGKPFIADVEAPFGKIYFLDERFLKVFQIKDWSFLDEDGNVLKWVTGFDAWEFALARYMNLGASRRNTELVMTGITNDSTGF